MTTASPVFNNLQERNFMPNVDNDDVDIKIEYEHFAGLDIEKTGNYHEMYPTKRRKRRRHQFTRMQLKVLKEQFTRNHYPDIFTR